MRTYSKENTKGVVEKPFDEEFIGLYKQRYHQFELKGMETGTK